MTDDAPPTDRTAPAFPDDETLAEGDVGDLARQLGLADDELERIIATLGRLPADDVARQRYGVLKEHPAGAGRADGRVRTGAGRVGNAVLCR